MLTTSRALAMELLGCSKCAGRRRRIGFVPVEQEPHLRIDLYRCTSCGEKSEEVVLAHWVKEPESNGRPWVH
jgi:hypothetical protein